MNLAEEAFRGLYPEKSFEFASEINYSGRFRAYNSNVRKLGSRLEFGLSREWRGVSREIVIGLLQHLMLRLFNENRKTINLDLYNNFVKSLHLANTNAVAEPVLMASFERVNLKYFNSIIEMPSLAWGKDSRAKLADYSFHDDTITVSSLFKNADKTVIDYLMHHELLHKKLKFKGSGAKSYFHTPDFKQQERRFEGREAAEQEISRLVRRKMRNWQLPMF